MLFDPREVDTSIESGSEQWQPPMHQPARRRPADGFLSIPSAETCPSQVTVKWRADAPALDLISRHFKYGPLDANDVTTYQGATNAMHDALFSWIGRECASWTRLNFSCALMDQAAVEADLQYTEALEEFDATSSLYLGFQTFDDDVYYLTPEVKAQFDSHPLLLRTALWLISLAGSKTISIRTPDDIFDLYANWLWDGEMWSTDEEAAEWLKERYEDDDESINRYKPSAVRAALCPDTVAFHEFDRKARQYHLLPFLSPNALKAKTLTIRGAMKEVCQTMLDLSNLLKKAGGLLCFDIASVRPQNFYAAATVAMSDNRYVSEALDDHYEYLAQSSEGSYFHGYVPLATNPKEIRRQYADLAHGFSILKCTDRLLALICTP